MHTRLLPQESQIVLQPLVVLAAADERRDLRVERLDTHLELQRPWGKPGDHLAQLFGHSVGYHLEMEETSRLVPLQAELEYGPAGGEVQIKRPVHEFELPSSSLQQALQIP